MPDPVQSLFIAGALLVVGLLLFWPEHGFFWSWQRARNMTEHVLIEDALKHCHRCERTGCRISVQSVAGDLNVTVNEAANILYKMESSGLLHRVDGYLQLTPAGQDYALQIIRAHRLWERYLADETGYGQSEWHDQAELAEHRLLPSDVDALSAQLGNPIFDPHGDPIPTADGELTSHGGQPLTAMEINQPLRIVHLEDEPGAVYAQLVAEGLSPGMEVRVIEKTGQRIRFWADLDEHLLAPIVAANISVVPLAEENHVAADVGERLSSLKPGEKGQVISLSRAYPAAERRRIMDLGILPGTIIEAEMTSPSGDPTAYRVRDTLIALRREQADLIYLTRLEEAA